MLPVQILLANLLTDFPLISVATDSVDVDELKKPKLYQLSSVLPLVMALALISTIFDFIFFAILHNQQPSVIQTLWFIESVLTELVLIFIIRTRQKFWKAKRASTPLILLSVFSAVFILILPFTSLGQKLFHLVAPPFLPLLIVFSLIAIYAILSEITKLTYFRFWKQQKSSALL